MSAERRDRAQDQREERLQQLEERIAESLRESAASGELATAPSWGRPMNLDDGYARTPLEFRMPMKVLKDAGVLPPEVEAMRQLQSLREQLERLPPGAERERLAQRAQDLSQWIALRLERLRSGAW